MMSTILIADDSRFMRNWLKDILANSGYTDIVEATDGKDVIEKYKRITPDVVILDITMPKVNGLEALKEILEFDEEAKVIMCSSMGTKSNIISALKMGAKDFVVKPDFNNIVDIIIKLQNHNEEYNRNKNSVCLEEKKI
nr:response regulator [Oceanobacillus salinisoli]